MNAFLQLSKRHMLLYFRDRSSVFFSLLSVLIVLVLMLVFLGDMNKVDLQNLLTSIGREAQEDAVQHVIAMWTIAGILSVNAFTIPISMIGRFVEDIDKHKLENFYTSPLPRSILMASYIASAILTSLIMSSVIILLSGIYFMINGEAFLNGTQLLQTYGILLLNILVSSSLVLCIAQGVRTMNAWGAFGTLAGTLIGFLGGIYIPLGALSTSIQTILKSMPFLHETAMLRSIMTEQPLQVLFGNQTQALCGYKEAMGITLTIQNQELTMLTQTMGLMFCGIILSVIAVYLIRKRSVFGR